MRNSAARGALVQQPVSRLPVIDAWHHVLDYANRKDLLGGLGAAHTRGSNDAEEGAVRQQLNRVRRSLTYPLFLALCRFVWNATALPDGPGRAERVSGQVLQT